MPHRIAIVTCSTRPVRINPFVSAHVRTYLTTALAGKHVTLETIDIADQNLPMYNEPAIPAALPAADPTPHYTHDYTRAWSTIIRQYDAFIFVTPQYNWSVPASLKNALDYLFHEWVGKPGAIVSYGGRGGGKAAGHLRDILNGLRMVPVSTTVALRMHGVDIARCVELGVMEPANVKVWQEDGEEEKLGVLGEELVEVLERGSGKK